MATGDPILQVGNLPGGANVDIALSVRAKIVHAGLATSLKGQGYLSVDGGLNFFLAFAARLMAFGMYNAQSASIDIGNQAIFAPQGTIVRIENNDTVAWDYVFNAVEY